MGSVVHFALTSKRANHGYLICLIIKLIYTKTGLSLIQSIKQRSSRCDLLYFLGLLCGTKSCAHYSYTLKGNKIHIYSVIIVSLIKLGYLSF